MLPIWKNSCFIYFKDFLLTFRFVERGIENVKHFRI
jgi:hypothetical protein